MQDIFLTVGRFFWLIAIMISFINAFILWQSRVPKATPEQRPGYMRYVLVNVLVNLILWGVMGFGIMVGGRQSLFFYLTSPTDPYVIAFYAAMFLLWIMSTIWVVFGGGADFFVRHPGLLNLTHPLIIKLSFSGTLLGASLIMLTQLGLPPLMSVPAIVAGLAGLAGTVYQAVMSNREPEN